MESSSGVKSLAGLRAGRDPEKVDVEGATDTGAGKLNDWVESWAADVIGAGGLNPNSSSESDESPSDSESMGADIGAAI